MNLFIRKDIIENAQISDEAFAVWCALRSYMQKDTTEYFISVNMLAYTLFQRVPVRRESEALRRGLQELIRHGYAKIIDTYGKSEWSMDLSALYFEAKDGYFSDITYSEVKQIMSLTLGNLSKYRLLRYYSYMVGSFNRSKTLPEKFRGKVGGLSMDYFAQVLGMSLTTISKYNEVLEREKLLYIVRNDYVKSINESGKTEIRELPNTYSRYKDKEIADSYTCASKITQEKQISANNKRSLAAKYNALRSGKEYDIETITEIYKYCKDTDRDLTVFNDYMNRIRERLEESREIAAFSIGE